MAIRTLENELGRPLFERRPEVRVTDFGQGVLAQMYVINDACDAIASMAAASARRSQLLDEQAKADRPEAAG